MYKAIKFKNNNYLDTRGIIHKGKILADIIYPVGSVYMSVNPTDPSQIFGGTWKKIQGRFLWATNNTPKTEGGSKTTDASTGSTGGPSTNTSGSTAITVDQMPSHGHTLYSNTNYQSAPGAGNWGWDLLDGWCYGNEQNVTNGGGTRAAGGGKGHTHTLSSHTHSLNSHTHTYMPPYFEVYMWYRTA